MEKFLIRKEKTEDSQEEHDCSSAKYSKLCSNDSSDEQESQISEEDDNSEDERDAHDESHASNSTCSTDNSNSLDKTDKCEASKKSDSNPIKKITLRGPGRKHVRCDVCFRNPNTVKIFAPNGRVPKICSENGIIPRKTNIDSHLRSVVHKECVKADKLARLSSNELQARAPIDSQFICANKELANYVGNFIYTVYNDAKRGTLSAFSWSSRVVGGKIGSKFDIN